MFQVARMIGGILKDVIAHNRRFGQKADSTFNATIILGGQVKGSEPRLFLIYPEGNFIEAVDDTPFFQIGETKYGRPILVRAYDPDMSFEAAAKLLMVVSFDSTIKANLSVGLPLDLQTTTTCSPCSWRTRPGTTPRCGPICHGSTRASAG
jgi:putative proteasome-type protease